MSGPWMPALVPLDGRTHAAEYPLSPTLCGLRPAWIAPHSVWPTRGVLCWTCVELARASAEAADILTAGDVLAAIDQSRNDPTEELS